MSSPDDKLNYPYSSSCRERAAACRGHATTSCAKRALTRSIPGMLAEKDSGVTQDLESARFGFPGTRFAFLVIERTWVGAMARPSGYGRSKWTSTHLNFPRFGVTSLRQLPHPKLSKACPSRIYRPRRSARSRSSPSESPRLAASSDRERCHLEQRYSGVRPLFTDFDIDFPLPANLLLVGFF